MLEEMRAEMQPPLGDKVLLDPTPSPICPEWEGQLKGKAYVYLRVDRKALELDSQIAVLRGELYKMQNELKQKSTPKGKREPKY